jgi:hypothetical protein
MAILLGSVTEQTSMSPQITYRNQVGSRPQSGRLFHGRHGMQCDCLFAEWAVMGWLLVEQV